MEFRFLELLEKFNNILDSISNYFKREKIQFDIKEIIHYSAEEDNVPWEWQLERSPNMRRANNIASYKDGIIKYSLISSQMIWYIAWLAYLIKDNQEDRFNTDDFIDRLIRVDKVINAEELSCRDLYAWDNEDLNSIFLYAMSFLICHEIGHNVYDHPSPEYDIKNEKWKYTELLRRNELQADSFAADCILEISRSDESAKYGILVAQLALLFIRNENVSFDTHPDPATRLRNTLDKIDITPTMERFIERARELSEIYVDRRFVH